VCIGKPDLVLPATVESRETPDRSRNLLPGYGVGRRRTEERNQTGKLRLATKGH
jgi:hypothetical protein